MKTKYVCHGLISLDDKFDNIPTANFDIIPTPN